MTRNLVLLALSALPLFGCALWDTPMSDPDCSNTPIDADTELLVAKPWLRDAEAAKNATAGTVSFAGQLAALNQRYPSFDAEALWSLVGVTAPTAPSQLPFRLLALVNRTDLAEQLAPESPAGEARLVYTLTNGPGDDTASAALRFTVIFEYSLGSARSVSDWSAAFHALSGLHGEGAPRLPATFDLVRSFVWPTAPVGAPYLSQLRVNDGRYGSPQLFELALDDSGKLAPRGLRNTPRPELADSAELAAFARDNATAIERGTHRVPNEWLAESVRVQPTTWLSSFPRLDHDFARGTCSGCHGAEGPGENGFHVSEAPDGSVKVSRFLSEDLARRAQLLRAHACGE